MKSLLPDWERPSDPLLPLPEFRKRVARSAGAALALVFFSMVLGMIGYHFLGKLTWTDSFLDASMLLGGMGPVSELTKSSASAKIFAGVYALYCGLVVIAVAGMLLAPIAHRMLHKFHYVAEDDQPVA